MKKSKHSRALLDLFPTLSKLREHERTRYGLSRYRHTLFLVKGLVACLKNDHSGFIRSNKTGRPTDLARSQFVDLSRRIRKIFRVDPVFALAVVVTHDYGVLHVPDARHFKMSGIASRSDLVNIGLPAKSVELAQLINGHHAYIGSLMLGENFIATADWLAKASAKLGQQKKFFMTLWMLTVLDINAAGRGYLSRAKYEQIRAFDDYATFKKMKKGWSERRMNLLRPDLTREGIPSRYFGLSFHYVFNVINEKKKGQYVLNREECRKLLSAFVELDGVLKGKGYDVISFQTDTCGTAVEMRKRLGREDKVVDKRRFLGWEYRVIDGYLEILNAKKRFVKKVGSGA